MYKFLSIAFFFLIIPVFLSAQRPAGFVAEYALDNNTATDQSGNNYNGSLTATNTDANRFGIANTAVAFSEGSSTGIMPIGLVTAIQNDFSMGFWFKTSMNAPGSSQWYGGTALVDAEVCGDTYDWGVALIDDGAVCMGIGASDVTIKTPLNNYNDGNWHFVTVTRNASAGTITLYMEGVEVATTAGTSTAALNAPNSIRMASNPCAPDGVYTGSLDDIIFYNRALTNSEVEALYLNASVLPLKWISFSGKWQNNKAVLQWETGSVLNNARFDIEHSIDGINFNKIGTVENNGGFTNAGQTSYTFSDNNASVKGTHLYRIKQVDTDNGFSFSKVIKLESINGFVKSLYIRSNPVAAELILMNDLLLKISRIEITDAAGRIVLTRAMKTSDPVIRLDVQQLKSGYYNLKVDDLNSVRVLPFIKP